MFSKEALNETVLFSTKLNNKTGEQNIFTILHSKLCSYGHIYISVSKIERWTGFHPLNTMSMKRINSF